MRKPPAKTPTAPGMPEFSDHRFQESYPTIVEFLTTTKYDDGSARAPSALSLFSEDGMVKAAMNDKDLKRSLYASADTLEGVLKALEGALQLPAPAWRTWGNAKRK